MCKKRSLETSYIFISDTVEWDWGHKQNLLGARTATARTRWGCPGVSERTSEKAQGRPGREHKVRARDQASRLLPMVLHSIYVTSLQQITPRGRAWKKTQYGTRCGMRKNLWSLGSKILLQAWRSQFWGNKSEHKGNTQGFEHRYSILFVIAELCLTWKVFFV